MIIGIICYLLVYINEGKAMKENIKKILDSWENSSEEYSLKNHTDKKINEIIKSPQSVFHPDTWRMISSHIPSFKNIDICVPSSGDNCAVFAFALMGANVTSCDISPSQLDNASKVAKKLNLDIEFVCSNTMELDNISSDSYDFVFTSNGVHVWIDDLESMYKNINRIMRKNAVYIMYDIHPFMRPFKDDTTKVEILKNYNDTNPDNEGIKHHWRIKDILNAMIKSNLKISEIEESFAQSYDFWISWDDEQEILKSEIERLEDYKTNPLAALPQWLSVSAIK